MALVKRLVYKQNALKICYYLNGYFTYAPTFNVQYNHRFQHNFNIVQLRFSNGTMTYLYHSTPQSQSFRQCLSLQSDHQPFKAILSQPLSFQPQLVASPILLTFDLLSKRQRNRSITCGINTVKYSSHSRLHRQLNIRWWSGQVGTETQQINIKGSLYLGENLVKFTRNQVV